MRYRVRFFSRFDYEYTPYTFWSRKKAEREFGAMVTQCYLKEIKLEKLTLTKGYVEIDHWVNCGTVAL